MYYVENKVELGHGAHQLGFEEGRPLLLQGALAPEVALWEGRSSVSEERPRKEMGGKGSEEEEEEGERQA